MVFHADVNQATKESTCGQYHAGRMNAHIGVGDDTGNRGAHTITLHDEVITGGLEDIEIRLVLNDLTDGAAVEGAVCLSAGGTHGRSLTAVKHTPLNTGFIGRTRHGTAKGIDFFHQMAFTDTTNGRVAGHHADGVGIVGQQQGFCAGTGSRQRSLCARMSTAYHNHVVPNRIIHKPPQSSETRAGDRQNFIGPAQKRARIIATPFRVSQRILSKF